MPSLLLPVSPQSRCQPNNFLSKKKNNNNLPKTLKLTHTVICSESCCWLLAVRGLRLQVSSSTLNSLRNIYTLQQLPGGKHDGVWQPGSLCLFLRLRVAIGDFRYSAAFRWGRALTPCARGGWSGPLHQESKHTIHSAKMASLPAVRVVLLVAFSVFLTVVLGFGLPALLNALMRVVGLPETSVTECIVALYGVFVLYVATPRIPRGLVEVRSQPTRERTVVLHSELDHKGDGNTAI